MAKQFSVFVNIAGKLDNSLPAAASKAEGILARIGKRMAAVNAGMSGTFARAAQSLDTAGKRIGEAGRTATSRISAPTGLLAFGAGRMAFEFEKAGNALEALGDVTSVQRKEFESFANELNKKYPQTLTGIINTGNEMLKGGFSFEQMKGALDQTLKTAVLGDMAPAEVGNMMARTINSFQLPMKTYEEAIRSSQRVSDQMTFAAVRTTASLKDMGEAYRYVGGAASAGGISFESTTGLLMAMAKNGSVGSDAGVALRSAIVRLVKMPPKALGALEAAGMKLGDYVSGGRKVTADNVLSGLQADGIDGSPVKKQIEAALNNKALVGSPVKLAAHITKLVQGAMNSAGSAIDASTIAQSVQDSITVSGSKIDITKFFTDLTTRVNSGKIGLGHIATILEGRHASRYMAIMQSNLADLIKQVETESVGYAESRYEIMLKGIVGPVYELSAALEKLSVALGRASFPTLAKGISAVADGIGQLSESTPGTLKFAAAVGIGAVALGPFLIAAGATVRVTGMLVRGLGLLGTAATLGLATRLVAVASGIKAIAVASTLAAVGRLRALAAGIIALGAVGGSRAVLAALAGSFVALGRAILALPLVMLKGALVGLAALFSPIGIAVAAVTTALAALGLWVYNNLAGIGTFFTSFGDAFMKALGPEASQNLTTVVGWLKQAWQWVNNLLGPIDETGKKWASWGAAAGAAAGAIVTAITGLPEKIGAIAKQGYDALVNFDWAAAGRALVEKIASGIVGAAGVLANALKGAVSGAVSGAWESAKGAIGLGSSAAPKPAASAPGAPAIAGARALGGPVTGGLPYLVGERGPEIFVPSTSGRIETNGVLNLIAKAGGRAAGGNGLTIGVDATAVEEAGKTAKAAGAQLHAALDATRKPVVDTTSIDAATAAAERLKAVLATVGAGNISLGGQSGSGGGAAASTAARVGRSLVGPGKGNGRAFTGKLNEKDMNPEVVAYIRAAAAVRGINPNTALAVADGEGLRGFGPNRPVVGDQGTSHGPFQLHYSGGTGANRQRGLGDDFTKATGLHARDPSTYKAQVDYALDHAAKHGWRAWYGRAHHKVGIWDGIGKRPAAKAAPTAGTVLKDGVEVGKLAGARAMGGTAARGLSYLVGERGPEVFTPGASGAISTNGALARLTDLGSRMTPADEGGRSPSIAPSPKAVAELRPQAQAVSTRGDTSIHNEWHIHGADNPAHVQRQVEARFADMIRQHESEQRGLLSD
ncbi:phage tail tape measure protein [Methylorubrum populi]